MTRKRFIKLFYALMQEINKEHLRMFGTTAEGWGKVLKGVQKARPTCSYAEAWEGLKTVREIYGMK